jgi:uncharacterized iron-regulated membrane protein
LFRRVHLALALVCGAILAAVGLTGSLLVVYQPILALEYGNDLFGPRVEGPPLPLEQWAGRLAHGDPAENGLSEIVAPHAAPLPNDRPMLLSMHQDRAIITVIDPDTGQSAGTFPLADGFSATIYYLHSQLLLSDIGATIISLAAIGLLLSLLTGLWLWWPRRDMLQALRPRRRQGIAALLQWHNLVGVYALIGLAVLAISGVWMTRPGWTDPPVSLVSPVRSSKPTGAADRCDRNLTFAEAAAVARGYAPDAELRFIGIEPDDGTGEGFDVFMRRPGDINRRLGDLHLEIGRHCPVVLAASAAPLTSGERLKQSMLGLHNGTILGTFGRVLVFAAGLALCLMFVSGLLLWLKRKARERRAHGRALARTG